jgi:hypothetical protein
VSLRGAVADYGVVLVGRLQEPALGIDGAAIEPAPVELPSARVVA